MKFGRLWQSRFWDHVIRNERDLKKHIDYIHNNPVKHGMMGDPSAYEHSSIRIFYEEGIFPSGWKQESKTANGREFGDD